MPAPGGVVRYVAPGSFGPEPKTPSPASSTVWEPGPKKLNWTAFPCASDTSCGTSCESCTETEPEPPGATSVHGANSDVLPSGSVAVAVSVEATRSGTLNTNPA